MKPTWLKTLTSALLAAGCSNQPVAKNCKPQGNPSTSFSVTGDIGRVAADKDPALMGGFIQFHLEKESDDILKSSAGIFSDSTDPRCSAMFRFTDIEGKPGAEITTAAHCFKGMQGLIHSIAVDIFDSETQKYFPSIPVFSPFIEKRNKALAELSQAGFSSAARQTVASRFMAGYASVFGSFDRDILRACSLSDDIDSLGERRFYQKLNNSSLCFTATDMAVIEVTFESSAAAKKLDPDVAKLLLKQRIAQEAAFTLADKQPKALLAKKIYAANRQSALDFRDYGLGEYIDHMALGCVNSKKTGTAATDAAKPVSNEMPAKEPSDPDKLIIDLEGSLSAATDEEIKKMKANMTDICPKLEKFRSVMDKYMTFRGKPADQMEKEIDFTDPIGMGPGWQQLSFYSYRTLEGSRLDLPDLVAQAQANIDSLKLHFNLVGLDRKEVKYASVKIRDISSTPSLLDFVWPKPKSYQQDLDSVFVNLMKKPSNTANFDFGLGDSGTLLSWNGAYPLYVLAVVDGKPSSGGASLINLPRRKSSDTESSQRGSASNEKDSKGKGLSANNSASCLH